MSEPLRADYDLLLPVYVLGLIIEDGALDHGPGEDELTQRLLFAIGHADKARTTRRSWLSPAGSPKAGQEPITRSARIVGIAG